MVEGDRIYSGSYKEFDIGIEKREKWIRLFI
jgi:hypothetical protein